MSKTEAVDRARTAAHRNAVGLSQQDLVSALVEKLGTSLTKFIAKRDATTITRWKTGSSIASEESLAPLRVAFQIIQMLERAEADATIRAWFIGINPQLDDLSPAEALEQGLNREALAAARAFLAGG